MFSLMPDTMANDGFVEFQQQRVNCGVADREIRDFVWLQKTGITKEMGRFGAFQFGLTTYNWHQLTYFTIALTSDTNPKYTECLMDSFYSWIIWESLNFSLIIASY